MTRQKIKYLFFLMIFFLGCGISTSTFQTGKVLKKGEWEGGAAYSLGMGYCEVEGETTELVVLASEWWTRYGAIRNLDIGLKYAFPFGIIGDLKYQILPKETEEILEGEESEEEIKGLHLSTGLGFGYGTKMITSLTVGDTTKETWKRPIDIFGRFYFSYTPIEWFSLYASPEYLLRMLSIEERQNNVTVEKKTATNHLIGSGIGISFNIKKVRLMGELNFLRGIGSDALHRQYGFGIAGRM